MTCEPASIHSDAITRFYFSGRLASIACLLEVCAPKPGNVHRGADFDDVGFEDFVVSAEMLGAVIDANLTLPVGEVILRVVKATRAHVGTKHKPRFGPDAMPACQVCHDVRTNG